MRNNIPQPNHQMAVDRNIYPSQAQYLINRLLGFLGATEVDNQLKKYEKSMECSGDVYSHYLMERHPWWNILSEYNKIIKRGHSFNNFFSSTFTDKNKWIRIISDAKMISEMYRHMPKEVRSFYKKNLIDDNAKSFLFELSIAWHYFINKCNIDWATGNTRKPEFVVSKDNFKFCVECKSIDASSFRNITRPDFYNLCDELLKRIAAKKLTGTIDLSLKEKLPSNIEEIRNICITILNDISKGRKYKEYNFGILNFDLEIGTDNSINVSECESELLGYKHPSSMAIIYTSFINKCPINPLFFTCSSQKKYNYGKKLYKVISKAAKEQLDKSIPGIISIFLPEVSDFSEFVSTGILPEIAKELFTCDRYSHVGSIIFSSDNKAIMENTITETFSQTLSFSNSNCKFNLPDKFPFMNQ